MAIADMDSSVGHSFGLEFDNTMIKSITEISGLKIEQDVGSTLIDAVGALA